MLPLSLLFSSDEQASQALSQALTELEFGVECCPEIFSAVEKITSRAFDIILSDWNEGLEAAFLLKTSRELKANHAAFTVAIADADLADAALEAGADLVLSRPLSPDAVKYALLTSDPFLAHMKTWLPKFGTPAVEKPAASEAEIPSITKLATPFPEMPRSLRAWPSPPPPRRLESEAAVVPADSIFDENPLYRARVESVFQREPSFSSVDVTRA